MSERPLRLDSALVEDFVRKAHGDFDGVKSLVEQEPALVRAVHDWGGGDWESALGAAAHVGRRDIAEFLLDKGALMDIFAAAMLGKLAIVAEILKDQPQLKDAKGPHGIPLLTHAKFGGEQAKDVLNLLESLA